MTDRDYVKVLKKNQELKLLIALLQGLEPWTP